MESAVGHGDSQSFFHISGPESYSAMLLLRCWYAGQGTGLGGRDVHIGCGELPTEVLQAVPVPMVSEFLILVPGSWSFGSHPISHPAYGIQPWDQCHLLTCDPAKDPTHGSIKPWKTWIAFPWARMVLAGSRLGGAGPALGGSFTVKPPRGREQSQLEEV